jgi:dienelactone hydrolase
MKNDPADLVQIDEALMIYDLSDEALEAAARVDSGHAMTVGYCATAGNAWYCLPFEQRRASIAAVPRRSIADSGQRSGFEP